MQDIKMHVYSVQSCKLSIKRKMRKSGKYRYSVVCTCNKSQKRWGYGGAASPAFQSPEPNFWYPSNKYRTK